MEKECKSRNGKENYRKKLKICLRAPVKYLRIGGCTPLSLSGKNTQVKKES